MTDAPRCQASVWVRDTYRVVRGGGFRMHYQERQCRRVAVGERFCRQHQKLHDDGRAVVICRFGSHFISRKAKAHD